MIADSTAAMVADIGFGVAMFPGGDGVGGASCCKSGGKCQPVLAVVIDSHSGSGGGFCCCC